MKDPLIDQWVDEAAKEWGEIVKAYKEAKCNLKLFEWRDAGDIIVVKGLPNYEGMHFRTSYGKISEIVDTEAFSVEQLIAMVEAVNQAIAERWNFLKAFKERREAALDSYPTILRKQLSSWKLLRGGVQPP